MLNNLRKLKPKNSINKPNRIDANEKLRYVPLEVLSESSSVQNRESTNSTNHQNQEHNFSERKDTTRENPNKKNCDETIYGSLNVFNNVTNNSVNNERSFYTDWDSLRTQALKNTLLTHNRPF